MSFRYFAYGSNLWPPQLRSRCPSAMPIGPATLHGWRIVCDKPSTDGSTKLNIRPDPVSKIEGVVYRIDDGERHKLDAAEPRYEPVVVTIDGRPTLTYTFEGEPGTAPPYDWYVATCRLGAAMHGISTDRFDVDPVSDPIAAGIRPATDDDRDAIFQILHEGLIADTQRHYIHPGDYAWWVYHDDPRHPDHFSTWLQDDAAFVTIDSLTPHEINVFARPGVDRMQLVTWAQRRLGDTGEVGWVAEDDEEMVAGLGVAGYEPGYELRLFRRNLDVAPPPPDLPTGWCLRPVAGEDEANNRRAASHAAFGSTMPGAIHLKRYLDFMRSPVYVPDRDLVAVSPEGVIAAFTVWWDDPSGIAQIEPFGTRPDFHRRGIGRALMNFALAEMRAAGMRVARVCSEDDPRARAFYSGVGFEDVGPLRWWRPKAASPLQVV